MSVPAALAGSPNWSWNSMSTSMPSDLPSPFQSLTWVKIGWMRIWVALKKEVSGEVSKSSNGWPQDEARESRRRGRE
jgi:hypothetical protein